MRELKSQPAPRGDTDHPVFVVDERDGDGDSSGSDHIRSGGR